MDLVAAGYRAGKRSAHQETRRRWVQCYGQDPRRVAYLIGPAGMQRWDYTTQQWVAVPEGLRTGATVRGVRSDDEA